MPKLRLLMVAVLLLLSGAGCASFVRMELPDEFKSKKLKEDPPITLHEPACPAQSSREA